MGVIWKVEANSGASATLISGARRKHIWRPHNMSPKDFFHFFPEGKLIEELALTEFLLTWK
jgi:hypothetical protein